MKLVKPLLLLLICCAFNTAQASKGWEIDKAKSTIEFFGIHVGNKFAGKLQNINGTINFDPNKLDQSFAKIKIGLKSVSTANKSYDGTLPQKDWFDIKNTPIATYETTKIKRLKLNDYNIEGILTIRGIEKENNFVATIIIKDNKATLSAKTEINRLDFNIGKSSDASGEWVSLKIPVNIKIHASKLPARQ